MLTSTLSAAFALTVSFAADVAPGPFDPPRCEPPRAECEAGALPEELPRFESRLAAPVGGVWWISSTDFADGCGIDMTALEVHAVKGGLDGVIEAHKTSYSGFLAVRVTDEAAAALSVYARAPSYCTENGSKDVTLTVSEEEAAPPANAPVVISGGTVTADNLDCDGRCFDVGRTCDVPLTISATYTGGPAMLLATSNDTYLPEQGLLLARADEPTELHIVTFGCLDSPISARFVSVDPDTLAQTDAVLVNGAAAAPASISSLPSCDEFCAGAGGCASASSSLPIAPALVALLVGGSLVGWRRRRR